MTDHSDNHHDEDAANFSLPHHNPLIGAMQIDTFHNVRDALLTLRDLTEVQDFGSAKGSLIGLNLLMTCIIHAVDFEIDHR